MTDKKSDPVAFAFKSTAMDQETFEVIGFEGTEEISQPYRFQIDLVADDPDIDLDKLLYAPAVLVIEKGDDQRKIHGVVSECRLSDALPDHRYRYQVILKPRIWLLSLSRQNQIYQDLSVPDIIAQEIKAGTAQGTTKDAKTGLVGDDYELYLTRKYPKREYTVQYQETDLNFISRLMEHEGIFYFFKQGDDREQIIISDNNIHFAALAGTNTLPYRSESGLDRAEDESISSFTFSNQRVPRKVVLKDYNYRLPHMMLQADSEVDADAHGLVCDYGEHFKTPEEGSEIARIRAQEMFAAKKIFQGRSDSIRLQTGWRFKLDDHFREAFNSEYVVTKNRHRGHQTVEGVAGLGEGDNEKAFYGNVLDCMPADVNYRPPRRTPKPIIPGLMHAHVDSAILENRAEIDDQGRYKLIMPYDLSGAAAGKASRYVRKAQPYGGRDMGMHFPLYKGTEVICSFVNGDPDRPIITGVVPNPTTSSVVTSDNFTKNVVKTGHGSFFEFNDGRGPVDKIKDAVSDAGSLAPQQQQQSMALTSASADRPGTDPEKVKNNSLRFGKLTLQQQQQLSSAEESSPGGTTPDDVWFRVKVPNYNSAATTAEMKDSYLRIGTTPADEKLVNTHNYKIDRTAKATQAGTYAVQPTDQNVAISSDENTLYTLTPSVTGITATSYALAASTLGATIDSTSGVITADIGYDKEGIYYTEVTINYDNTAGQPETSKTTITWTITEIGNELPPGWYDFTDGDHISVAMGNRRTITHGESKTATYTTKGKPFYYTDTHDDWGVQRKITLGHLFDYSALIGTKESYYLGAKLDGFVGASNSLMLASTLKACAGVNLSLNLDWNVKLGRQGGLSVIKGNDVKAAGESKTYGTKIKLRVMDKAILPKFNTIWSLIVGLGVGITGVGSVVTTVFDGLEAGIKKDKYDDTHTWAMAGMATAWGQLGLVETAKIATLLIAKIHATAMEKKWEAGKMIKGYPEIEMTNKRIKSQVGDNFIRISGNSIRLMAGEYGIAIRKNGTITVRCKKIDVKAAKNSILSSKVKIEGSLAVEPLVNGGDITAKTFKTTDGGWSTS